MLVEEALCSRPSLRVAIEPFLAGPWGPRSPTGMRLWQAARAAAAELHRHIRRLARADPDCRRLMTTPSAVC